MKEIKLNEMLFLLAIVSLLTAIWLSNVTIVEKLVLQSVILLITAFISWFFEVFE